MRFMSSSLLSTTIREPHCTNPATSTIAHRLATIEAQLHLILGFVGVVVVEGPPAATHVLPLPRTTRSLQTTRSVVLLCLLVKEIHGAVMAGRLTRT